LLLPERSWGGVSADVKCCPSAGCRAAVLSYLAEGWCWVVKEKGQLMHLNAVSGAAYSSSGLE